MNTMTTSMEQLPQDDLLKIILADLRRTVREYTTATTESSCPMIRNTFADLTDSTLRLQGDLYKLLEQHQVYTAPAKATRQEVDKKLQEAEKAHQKIHQFVQQRTGQSGAYQHPANVAPHPSNVGNYPSNASNNPYYI